MEILWVVSKFRVNNVSFSAHAHYTFRVQKYSLYTYSELYVVCMIVKVPPKYKNSMKVLQV
jgi:hypothetical protein